MKKFISWLLILAMMFCFAGCDAQDVEEIINVAVPVLIEALEEETETAEEADPGAILLDEEDPLANIPEFTDLAYIPINNNVPLFDELELTTNSYEYYSDLDELGRCGMTIACIGQDIMPTDDRGEIGSVKPTGWQSVKYDIVDGKYLYNRCHLIGFQLTGENANKKNLITGTRYLNIEGMLPFENMVADYVKETGNHVMYRVTPIYEGEELVARGVLMEGYSVEDKGEEICFCVYAYNNQPGIAIDYATGESSLIEE